MKTKQASLAGFNQSTIAACSASILLATAGPACADATSDRIADLERKLERSMQVIDELSNKVQRLEAATLKPGAVAGATEAEAVAARITGLEQQVSAIGNRSTEDDGIALHGFADVGLRSGNRGAKKGANLGSVGFYLAPQFGDRVKSLVELIFEASDAGDLAVDLERVQLGYAFSDRLTLWMGRFHTPYGYWNTAFHHGAQIQTSILRPRFLDFEDNGGILPAHGVGLWATGSTGIGSGKLAYDVYAANSPRIGIENPAIPGSGVLNPNISGSTNHNAMVGTNVRYSFGGALKGLTFGVHAFKGKVDDDAATAANRTDVRMAGGYGLYLENDWEVLSEYYRFSNKDISGATGSHKSWAGYLQAGRNFGVWTPYARLEKTSLDQTDNYFSQQASGQSYSRSVLGLRYDVNSKSALKLELNRTKLTDRDTNTLDEARVQYSVRF